MQMEDTNNAFGVVEDSSSAIPSLGNGIETSLQFSEVQEPEPKDVNQYLEYMRQKREALERAATQTDTEEITASVVTELDSENTDEKSEEAKEPVNEEGENMKKKDEMETDVKVETSNGESSIEDMVAQAMQQDEILLYQQKYLESLEARKNKVDTIIAMLQKEKETIDSQIQAVK